MAGGLGRGFSTTPDFRSDATRQIGFRFMHFRMTACELGDWRVRISRQRNPMAAGHLRVRRLFREQDLSLAPTNGSQVTQFMERSERGARSAGKLRWNGRFHEDAAGELYVVDYVQEATSSNCRRSAR